MSHQISDRAESFLAQVARESGFIQTDLENS